MFVNFIAFIMCAAMAVYNAIKNRIGFCILETALALANLPFAVVWLASLLKGIF